MVAVLLLAQAPKPPKSLTFVGKPKNIVFGHAEHVKAAGGKCDTCHPKLFPQKFDQSAIKFKGGMMHKTAVEAKASCGFCHHPNSEVKGAFDIKGNCTQCHNEKKS